MTFRISHVALACATAFSFPAEVIAQNQDPPERREGQPAIPEIVVKGSKSLNADIRRTADDIQPYTVFDREAIAASGASNIADFLRAKLPMASAPALPLQSAGIPGNVSRIDLRGLGANQTLVLIDGRRAPILSTSGGSLAQPDLNGIPLSAIERIEVLPAASGMYGGGATGGVVNVILRRNYNAVETGLTYRGTTEGGAPGRQIDLGGGLAREKTSLMFAGSYADSGGLAASQRDYLQRGRDHILAVNPAGILGLPSPPLGATSNIRSTNGSNLQLKTAFGGENLGASQTFIPQGYGGVSADGVNALSSNAGSYNLAPSDTAQRAGGGGFSLLGETEVSSAVVSIKHQPWEAVEIFLDTAASRNRTTFASVVPSSTFTVSASAPNNPFNQDISVTTPLYGVSDEIRTTLTNYRALGGLTIRLTDDWSAQAEYAWSRVRLKASAGNLALAPQAAASVRSGAVDILRDTRRFPITFAPFELAPVLQTNTINLKSASARLSGTTDFLTAGPVSTTLTLEHRLEELDAVAAEGNFLPERSQSVRSALVESRIPLVSSAMGVRGIHSIELQLAARYDDYIVHGARPVTAANAASARVDRGDGSSVDPTVGLRFQPIDDVTFRASWSTGYLPPNVSQLTPNLPTNISAASAQTLRDPGRGNEPLGAYSTLTGGQPDLKPEESRSTSAGIIINPRLMQNLRFSVDWTGIRKRENIVGFGNSQDAIDIFFRLMPERIVRGTPPGGSDPFPDVGRITALDIRLANISQARIESLDFDLDFSHRIARLGEFGFSALATKLMKYDLRTTSLSAEEDVIGTTRFGTYPLQWIGNASVSWANRGWSVEWSARYSDEYWLNTNRSVLANQGSATVPRQIYHDLFAGYRFSPGNPGDRTIAGVFSALSLDVSVMNLFNKAPPIDVSPVAQNFYSPIGDPRGTHYAVTLRAQF